jgi:hypothetical protein
MRLRVTQAASSAMSLPSQSGTYSPDPVTRREFEAVIYGLRDYIGVQFANQNKIMELMSTNADKAIGVALDSMNIRQENTNEWRGALDKYVTTLATKEGLEKLEKSVSDLQLSEATLKGKATMGNVIVSYAMAAVGWILGAIAILIKFIK